MFVAARTRFVRLMNHAAARVAVIAIVCGSVGVAASSAAVGSSVAGTVGGVVSSSTSGSTTQPSTSTQTTAPGAPTSGATTAPVSTGGTDPNGPLTAQTDAEALALAAQSGRDVIVLAHLSEGQMVTAHPDGTLSDAVNPAPVRIPDASSPTGFTPVDTKLANNGEAVKPAAVVTPISFSDGGSGPLATITLPGDHQVALDWTGELPNPKLDGNTATYENALPGGIDVHLQAGVDGFEQSWIITSAPQQALSLRIPLDLNGLTAKRDDSGDIDLVDTNGKLVGTIGQVQMWGAGGETSDDRPFSTVVDSKIVADDSGAATLVVTPDPQFFSQPGLEYPVTIDPTVTTASTDIISDYLVNSGSPTHIYRTDSSAKDLQTGSGNGTAKNRSYFKFTAPTAVSSPSYPIYVTGATLNLWENDAATTCGTKTAMEVHNVAAAVTGSGSDTWNTQPGVGTNEWGYLKTDTGANATTCAAGTVSPKNTDSDTSGSGTGNMGQFVRNWLDGSADYPWQLVITATTETSTAQWKHFNSDKYGSNPPTLTIDYVYRPNVPTSLSADPIFDPVPTLTATYSDPTTPTADAGYLKFQVARNSGTLTDTLMPTSGTVASGTAETTPSFASAWSANDSINWDVRGCKPVSDTSSTGVTLQDCSAAAPTTSGETFTWTPDTTDPNPPTSLSGTDGAWHTDASKTVTASGGSDTSGGSGFSHYEHRDATNGGSWSSWSSGATDTISAEGTTIVQFRSVDNVGRSSNPYPSSPTSTSTVKLDRTAPATPTIGTGMGGTGSWVTSASVDFTPSSSDTTSGIAYYNYRTSTDGTTWSASTALPSSPLSITAAGTTYVQFQAVDNAGNQSSWGPSNGASNTAMIDRIAPAAPTVGGSDSSWHNSTVTISASAGSDTGGSGLTGYEYQKSGDGGSTWLPTTPTAGSSVGITAEGTTLVRFRSVDGAGNRSGWAPTTNGPDNTAKIDLTSPSDPTSFSGGSLSWQDVASVDVTVSGSTDTGGSGVGHYEYRTQTNGGSWSTASTAASDEATVSAEGETLIQFRAVDVAGNTSAWAPTTSVAGNTVRIDRTAPTAPTTVSGGSYTWTPGEVDITASGSTDTGGSGVAHYEYETSNDGGSTWSSTPTSGATAAITATGETLVRFRAVDNAGNSSSGWVPASNSAANTARIGTYAPTISSSTHDDDTEGSIATTFDASWADPVGMTGVTGYAVVLDQAPSTTPAATVTQTESTFEAADLDPGTYYLHVRATDGTAWSNSGTFEFTVLGLMEPTDAGTSDGTVLLETPMPHGATAVRFQFRTSDDNDWNTIPDNRLATMDDNSTTQPVDRDPSTGASYELKWDAAATSSDDSGVDADNSIAGANEYVSVRAVMTSTSDDEIIVPTNVVLLDMTKPRALAITPDAPTDGGYITGTSPAVSWSPDPADTDIAGYSVVVDGTSDTVPAATISTTDTSTTATSSVAATKYVHVRPVDEAGNWGTTQTVKMEFEPMLVTSPLPESSADGSAPLDLGITTSETSYICWAYQTPAQDDTGGWTDVPAADVSEDETAIDSWPVTAPAGTHDLSWSNFADATGIDDYPGLIRLSAWSVPTATSDCDGDDTEQIGETTVEFSPSDTESESEAMAPLHSHAFALDEETETDPIATGDGRIFFSAYNLSSGHTLYHAAMADGTEPTSLGEGDASQGVSASADGAVVAQEEPGDGRCDSSILLTTLDGTTSVTVDGSVRYVAVSPDGTSLAFTAEMCDPITGDYLDRTALFVVSTSTPPSTTVEFGDNRIAGGTDLATVPEGPVFTADSKELIWRDRVDGGPDTIELTPIDPENPDDLSEGTLFTSSESEPLNETGLAATASTTDTTLVLAIPVGNNDIKLIYSDSLQSVLDSDPANSTDTVSVPQLEDADPIQLGPWSPSGAYLLVGRRDPDGGYDLDALNSITEVYHHLRHVEDVEYAPTSWTGLSTDPTVLGLQYRPHMFFDSLEKWYPISPEDLLSENAIAAGFHKICSFYHKTITNTGRYPVSNYEKTVIPM